jgi:hypothetical protein
MYPKMLKFYNVPSNKYDSEPFEVIVAYVYDRGEDEDPIIVSIHDDFDVTLSVSRAEVLDDEFGSWVINDILLFGTLTGTVQYGTVSFSVLSLNIPKTNVWLKASQVLSEADAATTSALTAETLSYITILETKVNTVDADDVQLEGATGTAFFSSVSTHSISKNQYVVNANIFDALNADKAKEDTEIQGTFVVRDLYESSDCDVGKRTEDPPTVWYRQYEKLDTCTASSNGIASTKVTSIDTVTVTMEIYPQRNDCVDLGSAEDLVTNVRFKNSCIPHVDESTQSPTGHSLKLSAPQTAGACPSLDPTTNEIQRIVRIRNYASSEGTGLCRAAEGIPHPVIRTYVIGTCYILPGGVTGSFIFSGCVSDYRSFLDVYTTTDCQGTSNQRDYGAECWVGSNDGWGIEVSGNDISLECDATC